MILGYANIFHHHIYRHTNTGNATRLNESMLVMQNQSQVSNCSWNEGNSSQNIPISNATMIPVSNAQTTTNSMLSNLSYNSSTSYSYHQQSYQGSTSQTSSMTSAKRFHPNRSLSMVVNNNYNKNDVNSPVSLDSITPSITADHVQQEIMITTEESPPCQAMQATVTASYKPTTNPTNTVNVSKTASSSSNPGHHKTTYLSDPIKDLSLSDSSVPLKSANTTTQNIVTENGSTVVSDVSADGLPTSHEPPSRCSECSMVFALSIDLKKHIDLVHQGRQGGKKYQCAICAVEFDEKIELKEHIEKHALEKPFKCDICGVRFANQAGQKRHKQRLHETLSKSHSCNKCGKQFFDKHDLKRHEKIHTKECNMCGKKLGIKEDVPHKCDGKKKKKGEEETGDPELKCTICGVFTSNKLSWGYHMWKHTKDPKYINLPVSNVGATKSTSPKLDSTKKEEQTHEDNTPTNATNRCEPIEVTKPKLPAEHSLPSEVKSKDVRSQNTTRSIHRSQNRIGRNNHHILDTFETKTPPDAHALSQTSFAQSSQPLCLRTSTRKPLLAEKEMKPLNMQIVNS